MAIARTKEPMSLARQMHLIAQAAKQEQNYKIVKITEEFIECVLKSINKEALTSKLNYTSQPHSLVDTTMVMTRLRELGFSATLNFEENIVITW